MMTDTEKLYIELSVLRDNLRSKKKAKICTDDALKEIVMMQPRKISDFESISGVGKVFIEKYANDFLKILNKYYQKEEGQQTVKLNKSSLNTLKELEKKLVNISKRNRLLYMPKVNAKYTVDLYRPAFDVRKICFSSGKEITVAKNTDPDFKKLVSLLRAAKRNLRDKGQNNLFLAYPFVKGQLYSAKDKFNIRAPLALFPVKEERTANSIKLKFDSDREALYNSTLIIANNKFNNINKSFPEVEIEEIKEENFVENLLSFYKENSLEIKKESLEEELHALESYTADTFPEYNGGELFFENAIALGLFEVCSSSIQKDFQQIALDGKINSLLNNLLMPGDFKPLEKENLFDVPEENIFYINNLNAAQETVLTALDNTDELVVQGPPGTGKSQTITSLIASYANQGKKVLMVSEKKTALDVVYSRLGDLSKYALLIDDVNNKENFYRQLSQMLLLEKKVMPDEEKILDAAKNVTNTVNHLKIISEDYYKADSFGVEPYKLYINNFYKDMKDESVFKKAFMIKEALPAQAAKLTFPQILEAHNIFSDKKNICDAESYTCKIKFFPWMNFIREDLSDFEFSEMDLEFKNITSAFDEKNHSGILKKITLQKKYKNLSKKFFKKYFTKGIAVFKITRALKKYRGALAEIFESGQDFLQTKVFYTKLSESSKIYFDTLLKIKGIFFNKIDEAEKELYQYLPSAHLMDFEAAHREVFPYIKNFSSIIDDMEKNMDKKRLLSRKKLESLLSQNILYLSESKRRSEIMRVVNSKRKWGVNKFITKFNFELFKAVQVWLLTPEVVSEILPLEMGLFDLVVFDEASQMYMEKGIPSILRGKKVVIAGDQKQLRPSSLGTGRFEIDEDAIEDSLEEMEDDVEVDSALLEEESLLDLARFKYNDILLNFHYRSKYEELIAFSNYAFYDGKLYVSPNTSTPKNPPIEVLKLNNGKWINRKNNEEAKRIIELLKEIFATRKNEETIGIITFNTSQRDLIEDLIDHECSVDQEFALNINSEMNRKMNGEDIGLFVKNIESVQGDERDIIIFSVGYAQNEKGKLIHNFGWLNQQGGENRLNVAISRAKKKIFIVTSILPGELKIEGLKNSGPYILKKYLEYAFAVSEKNADLAKEILNSLKGISCDKNDADEKENAKEEELIHGQAIEAEYYQRLYDELNEKLKAKGFSLERNVGIASYTIDFAVRKDDEYLLGIECDSKLYKEKSSVRERDFYRQKYLESRGWKIYRLWSELWAKNKDGEIEKIISLLNAV